MKTVLPVHRGLPHTSTACSRLYYKIRNASPTVKVLLSVAVLTICIFATIKIREVLENIEYGRLTFFSSNLPSPREVATWTEDERDERLQSLSKWGFDVEHWRKFVHYSTSGLSLPTDPKAKFSIVEIGCGVGAFARVLLKEHPQATYIGIDLVPAAIDIAKVVLPPDRAQLYVGDAITLSHVEDSVADYVLLPGVLCYLQRRVYILEALKEVVRVAKDGGKVTVTMIPYDDSGRNSCVTYIEKEFWTSGPVKALGISVIELQNMQEWKGTEHHGYHRYAAFLKVTKSE